MSHLLCGGSFDESNTTGQRSVLFVFCQLVFLRRNEEITEEDVTQEV